MVTQQLTNLLTEAHIKQINHWYVWENKAIQIVMRFLIMLALQPQITLKVKLLAFT